MTTFETFCTELAHGDSDLGAEDVASRINTRILRAWADDEYRNTPHQLVSDLLDQLSEFKVRLLVDALLAPNPQTVTWRLLRDQAVAAAAKDAAYCAQARRDALGDPEPVYDAVALDRRALSKETP